MRMAGDCLVMSVLKNSQSVDHKSESVKIEWFEAYRQGQISLNKLAELLEIPLEEAKVQLQERKIPLDLGVRSEVELLSDLENA